MPIPAAGWSAGGARTPFWGKDTREPSQREKTAPAYVHCNGCDNVWTGLRAAHCSSCHRTFTGVTAFDMHRSGSHANSTRHCVDPASVGLVPVASLGGHWTGWGKPGENPRWSSDD
jgi:hypothetical protein